MRKAEKEEKIGELKQLVESASGLVLLTCVGVSGQQMAGIRRRLKEAGCPMKVVRNTLFRRALEGTAAEALVGAVQGSTSVVGCGEDLVGGAKAVVGIEAEAQGLRVKAGFLGNRMRSRDELLQIANLPPKDVLLGQLFFVLQSPLWRVIQTLEQPMRNIIAVIGAAAQKGTGT